MSVTPRSRSEFIGTGTSPTLAEPAGAQTGDVLFAFAVTTAAGAVTPPPGWTTLYAGVSSVSSWVVSWIRRGETAPSLTWGLTGSVPGEFYLVCLQRQEGPLLLHAQSVDGAVTAASTVAPNPPPVTTTLPTGLALCVGQHFNGSVTTGWACAGYTAQTSNPAGADGCVFSKGLVAAGVEDPPLWTTGGALGSNNLWDGATVVFADVPVLTAGYGSSPVVLKKTVPRQQRLT